MRRVLILAVLVAVTLGALPGGVAAQDNSTATPAGTPTATPTATPTPTPQSGGETTENSSEQPSLSGVQAVQVYVEQPRYVDQPPDHSMTNGLHTYSVRGEVHELDPDGFNGSQVVRAGIREDAATLTYDKAIDRWVLDSQGTAGTFRVFWTVREGGDTTTYAANIQVSQASYQHIAPSRYEDLQSAAANWEWTVDQFESAGLVASDAALDATKAVIEDAVTWYKFYTSPFSALSGQFITLGIMLAKWPAGWIILGSLLLVYFIRDRHKTKQNRRFKRQFASIEDVDEAERRAEERELKRIFSMKTFTDLGLTESDAEAVREHCNADNPRQFAEQIRQNFTERRGVRLLLNAYDQLGHKVRVRRDADGEVTDIGLYETPLPGEAHLFDTGDVAPDGGVAAASGGSTDDITYRRPASLDDDLILQLDWLELDPAVLWDDALDTSEIDWPIANDPDAEDDLVADFGVPIGEDGHEYYILERREEFAEILVAFMQHTAASAYTDDDGRIRPDIDFLDFMYTFTATSSEKYRWPLTHTRDILHRARQLLDSDERMRDIADRSGRGEL